MSKQENKSFDLRSLSFINLIVFLVLSVALTITYFASSWWYESSTETPYQPVYMASGLVKKLQQFRAMNNRYPNDSTEFLTYLKVKKPTFIGNKGAFFLKNYVYTYQKLNENVITIWAIPAPQPIQFSEQTDPELYQRLMVVREEQRQKSPLSFIVIGKKGIKMFQGFTKEKLSDIDSLPTEPTTLELNQFGLFERK